MHEQECLTDMSKDASDYQNRQQRATELRDLPAHEHRMAEQQGKNEHLTGSELSRQALEHSPASQHEAQTGATVGHGIAAFGHADIAALAHELWQARGCPDGSPEEDWFRAAEELRARARTR